MVSGDVTNMGLVSELSGLAKTIDFTWRVWFIC
jgi:hypothetical protein